MDQLLLLGGVSLPGTFAELSTYALALALGLFVGLEREWADRFLGAQVFPIACLLGALGASAGSTLLLGATGTLVLLHAGALTVRGSVAGDDEVLLTSAALVLVFVVGALVGLGRPFAGISATVATSFLLLLEDELGAFADSLTDEEIESAAQLALLAFVLYPVLPDHPILGVNPRDAWILMVAIGALGFVNYAVMQYYDSGGLALTGFVGGLVSSTAAIASVGSRFGDGDSGAVRTVVGIVLLANAAMLVRNIGLVVLVVPEMAATVTPPLVAAGVVAVIAAVFVADWNESIDMEFEEPFELERAVKFGVLFAGVLAISSLARTYVGSSAFVLTNVLAGAVSSASATTAAVTLLEAGKIDVGTAALSILGSSAASIFVKVGLVSSMDSDLVKPVGAASVGLAVVGGLAYGGLLFFV
ncbi:MgtC/SapB family protein [Halospeciosus flavus]|uniref:MgtC/SapB family protein n=1 Tax=Halospeciosus flavus TaxID=3032283 RepID=A0ABD5Z4L6_9EURY|nr:DUF4010 domain-containing protein [Halospeciosus flavus]